MGNRKKKKKLVASSNDIWIARVVGENEESLTLLVPKDMTGVFHLEGGEAFYSIMFVHNVDGKVETWVPWRDRDRG